MVAIAKINVCVIPLQITKSVPKDSQTAPKWTPEPTKIDVKEQPVLDIDFFMVRGSFWKVFGYFFWKKNGWTLEARVCDKNLKNIAPVEAKRQFLRNRRSNKLNKNDKHRSTISCFGGASIWNVKNTKNWCPWRRKNGESILFSPSLDGEC